MNQDYQELIRQMLDEAGLINKELTFGCQILNTWAGKTNPSRIYTFTHKNNLWNGFWFDGKVAKKISIHWTKHDDGSDSQVILGHPWDLREVMAWFQKKWMLWDTEIRLILNLDLSKPLSQQDLKPLYELMSSLNK